MPAALPRCAAVRRHFRLIGLFTILAPLTVPAQAPLEDIIVTARRLDENLQEIPVAVSVISEQRIEIEAVRDLTNIADLTPSLQFDQGFWPNDTRVSIRGLFNRAGRPSAAILVDGIDAGSEQLESAGGSALLNQRLLDIERVEVAKGPQVALYGRAAFAGAINYVTRRPTMDWSANGSLDIAPEDGRQEFRAGVSGPIIEDKLAFRLAGSAYTLDGYYDNPNTGDAVGGGDSDGASLGLLWTPVDTFDAYLNVSYTDDEFDPPAIAAVKANTILGPVAGTSLAAVVGKISAKERDINASPDPRVGTSDYPGTDVETWRANLIVNWEVGAFTLESRTGYLDSDQDLKLDTTQQFGFTPPSAGNNTDANYEFEYEQWQQELLFRPTVPGRFNWLVGVQGFYEEASDLNNSRLWFRDPDSAACGSGVPCTFADTSEFGKTIERDTTSYSAFGLLGIAITDQLNFTAEARWIYDEVEVEVDTAASLANTLTPTFLLPPGYPGPPPDDDVDDTNLVPRFTLDYSLGESALVYASASKGIKPPTYNVTDLTDPDLNQVDKEDLWAYEVGAKTSWFDDRLILNGAVYYNDYEDQQVLVQFAPAPGTFIPRSGSVNAAEVDIWGIEAEVLWQPMEYLTLSASYSYVDGEYDDFNLSEIPGDPSTSNQVKAGNPEGDFSGNDIVGIPDHAFAFLARYDRQAPFGRDLNWFAQVTGNYQGERNADIANLVTLDSYWLANLQLGIGNDTWTLIGYAENLFDDDTIRYAQEFIDQQEGFVFGSGFAFPVAYYAYLPQPQTLGVRLLFRTP